jgi:hypothetical protein
MFKLHFFTFAAETVKPNEASVGKKFSLSTNSLFPVFTFPQFIFPYFRFVKNSAILASIQPLCEHARGVKEKSETHSADLIARTTQTN